MPNTKKIKSKKNATRRIIIAKNAHYKSNVPLWFKPKYIKNGRVDWTKYTKEV